MKVKRFMAATIIFTILLSFISYVGVYAADVRMSINWFEQSFEEVVVISIDTIITEDNRYSIEFSAPANPEFPQDINQKQSAGMVAFRNGEISLKPDGSWISNNQELADGNIVSAFEMNVMHNLKLKHTRRTGNIAIYVDDSYIGEYNMKTPVTAPINCATIIADSTIKTGMELKVDSVAGAKEGAMSVVVNEHNSEDRTINISMSEEIKNTELIEDVVLMSTNTADGKINIPLSIKSFEGENITFGYTAELEKSTEYALAFPEGIEGKLGGKMEDRFYYFVTDADITVEKIDECTYEDGIAKVGLTLPKDVPVIVDTDESHIKAYNVAAYNDAGFQYIWHGYKGEEFKIPEENLYSISFDIKPSQERIKMGIELRPKSGSPVSLAYGIDGYILAMVGWTNDGWLNLTDVEQTWANNNLIGKYSTDEWITFKAEFNKTDKSVAIYLNGNKKYTKTDFGELKEIAFHTPVSSNCKAGASVMFLDNIVKEKISQLPTINKIRFYDADGNAKGAFDTTDRLLDIIELDFSAAMDSKSLNDETIALMYNDEKVDYVAEYDEENLKYIIKPSKIIPSGGKVCITADGATDTKGEKLNSYRAEVYAYEGDDSLEVRRFSLVDAEGEKAEELSGTVYAQTLVANMSDVDRDVIISLMGYKDSALYRYDYEYTTIEAKTMCKTDIDINAINIDTETLDSIMLSINDADTGCPLNNSVVIEKTAVKQGEYAISQKTNSESDKNVNIEVYAPGKSFADMTAADDFRDVLVYKKQVTTGEDGSIADSFSIDYEDAVSGMYKVCLSADGYSHSYDIFYTNAGKTKEVFEEALKPALEEGKAEDIADVILKNHYDLNVDNKYMNEEIALNAAKLVADYNERNTLSSANAGVIVAAAVAVAAFDEGDLTDIIADAERFDLADSKLSKLYNESFVTDKVSEDITDRMSKKHTSIDAFYDELYDAFILAVVANPAKPNCIKTVLEAFGIEGSDKAYAKISGEDYNSVSEMKNAIKAATDNKNTSKGSGSGGGGGRVSVANTPVIAEPEEEFSSETAEVAEKFDDIDEVVWAKDAILALADKGVVNGKEIGKYYPFDNVTREEFTKMIVIAFGIEGSGAEVSFVDIIHGAWYEEYIKTAFENGIINGYSDILFGVGENITREDMAVMICRAASYKGIELGEADNTIFADDDSISDYAKASIYEMKNAGVINGKNNNMFAPKDYANRAEAAKMIYGVLSR